MASDDSADGENDCGDGDTDLRESIPDESEEQREIREKMEAMDARIDEIREEMIHPRAAQKVLEHTGLSESKAADLVETMQEVDRRTRADDSE